MTNQNATAALKMVADAIVEAVRAGGRLGTPGGTLYAALMAYGCTLEQFEQIMSSLVTCRLLEKRGDLYFPKVGR